MAGRPSWRVRRPRAVVAVAGLIATALVLSGCGGEGSAPAGSGGRAVVPGTTDLSAADLARVSRTRVFLGHQSVGMNVLDGVAGVFATRAVPVPPIARDRPPSGVTGGFIAHAFIGENERPLGKIRDFDARVRSGLGDQVDVAMMKFCYVDITGDTDVDAVFTAYRDALAALERDYPHVTFVASTVPLTTEPGLLSRTRALLAGKRHERAAQNLARERLNTLIRRRFGGPRLFDLAAIESTAPDGTRVSGRYRGQEYFALYEGYAADDGHLNREGARRAATAWLTVVAGLSPGTGTG